jgi:hypothetical protein
MSTMLASDSSSPLHPAAPPRPGPAWHVADVLTVIVGVLLVFGGTAAFALEPQVQEIDPRDMEVAARLNDLSPGGWLIVIAMAAAGMIAAAGLPRPRTSDVAVRSAAGQLVAAVLAVVATTAASWWGATWIFAPPDRCVYASCWPANAQAAAIAAPGVLSAVALVVAALLVRKRSWAVRAITPAGFWIAAVLVLRVVWHPWLLPLFQAPPP